MKFVEDSGTSLASPSQTLYLSGDPASKKDKVDAAIKQAADQTFSVPGLPDAQQSQSAVRARPRNTGDNAGKDD
jgi:hypothetical protein